METQDSTIRDDEFWKAHILNARRFKGSNHEYCRVNDLPKGTFYSRKKRLGLTKRRRVKRRMFVKVTPVAERPRRELPALGRQLPDPKWVAHLIVALAGEQR